MSTPTFLKTRPRLMAVTRVAMKLTRMRKGCLQQHCTLSQFASGFGTAINWPGMVSQALFICPAAEGKALQWVPQKHLLVFKQAALTRLYSLRM